MSAQVRGHHFLRDCVTTSLTSEVHIAVLFQESEVSDKVEFHRVAHLHLGQVRDFGEVAFAVAPVQSYGDEFVPCSGRIAAPLVFGEIVEGSVPIRFAADDDDEACGSATRFVGRAPASRRRAICSSRNLLIRRSSGSARYECGPARREEPNVER